MRSSVSFCSSPNEVNVSVLTEDNAPLTNRIASGSNVLRQVPPAPVNLSGDFLLRRQDSTMSDRDNNPGKGWLPTLDAGQRFPAHAAELTAASTEGAAPTESEPQSSDGSRESLLVQDWPSALETQFGLSSPLHSVEPEFLSEPEILTPESLESMQDRLAYYEHFDSLIKDNVSRSAALFHAYSPSEKKRGTNVMNLTDRTKQSPPKLRPGFRRSAAIRSTS